MLPTARTNQTAQKILWEHVKNEAARRASKGGASKPSSKPKSSKTRAYIADSKGDPEAEQIECTSDPGDEETTGLTASDFSKAHTSYELEA